MNDSARRVLGLVTGLMMGLAYGLVSQLINPFFLPGVPLFHPGSSLAADILFTGLVGGLIGLISAWFDEALPGVLLGSLAGALITTLFSFVGSNTNVDYFLGLFVLLIMTFLPRAVVFVPLAALTRWTLHVWAEEFQSVSFSIVKLLLSLLLPAALAGALGAFSLYPSQGRQALQATHHLIQMGMQATTQEGLPEALKKVDGFLQNAHGAYTLELSDDPDILPIQRPLLTSGEQEYAVLVRFENGYRFGCVFTPNYPQPVCGIY